MRKYFKWLLVVGLTTGLLNAVAGTFEILNESFESPAVTGQVQTDPEGWIRVHAAQNYNGLWNEDSGIFTTPYGDQVASAWTQGGFLTTNITDVVQPGTTYTLTFNVGNLNGTTGDPRSDNQYTADIMAGTTVVASVSGTTTTDDMSESDTVVLVVGDTHPNLGETLGVRLRMTGGDWHAKALFDNVRLVANESGDWARSLFYGK